MSTCELAPEATSSLGAFRHLWSASLVSTLGDGALLSALPLLAASLTRDPRLISAVTVTGRLPWLTLALFGGVIVDRLDRHRLMLWAQAGQMLLVTLITLVVVLGLSRIWMLCVFAFAIGCGDVLFQGSSQALVPAIVGRDDLDAANGRLVAVEAVSHDFLGPPAGSVLFALAVAAPFGFDAVSFAISLLLIRRIKPPPRAVTAAPRRAMLAEIGEGLRWLTRARLPRTLTLITAGGNFCEAMALSLLVLFARQVLGVGGVGYGVLLAAMAAGGVVGGIFSAKVVHRLGARTVAIAVEVISPAAWLAIAAFGRNMIVVVAMFTVFSLALSMWNVVSMSTRQRLVPNELLGRVVSASRMLAYGATPLGALAGGFVASEYGLIAPWLVGGVLSLLVAVVSLPSLWRWDS
jgi:predicted MFS family arabinose efflux permease